MKEKTFEKLIDEKFGLQFDKSEKEEIKELLQQVREVTLVESFMAIMKDEEKIEVQASANKILLLPTDRIKIEE